MPGAFAALYAPGEYVGSFADSTTVSMVTAGTRVQVTATATNCTGVVVTASENNNCVIVVGGSDVVALDDSTRRGYVVLQPGASAVIPARDMSLLYIDSTAASSGALVGRVLAAPIKG